MEETIQYTLAPNCHILTNSPALHSLKRQQLVQLCKRNGIKATGKNSEIIEKLKAHASSDNPLDPSSSLNDLAAVFSSDDDNDKENRRIAMPRPSEAWTVIEEDSREVERMHLGLRDIREEVEQEINSMGSLRGFGAPSAEFGNGTTSSKGSSITLSLKSFANSFKRGGSKMSTATAAGISASAHIEHAPFSDTNLAISTPVRPEPALRGTPLPSPATIDGDESKDISILDYGASTIRLVTSQNNNELPSPPALRPFTPTFQASFSPGPARCLSPNPATIAATLSTDEQCNQLPGAFPETILNTPTFKIPTRPPLCSSPAPPPPFVFGSPDNRISKDQFTSAAAIVLAEMNARLGLTGTEGEVGIDILEKRRSATQQDIDQQDKSLLPLKNTEITQKFDKAHELGFQKMEGLGEYYARRAAAAAAASSPGKATTTAASPSKKKKSDVLAAGTEKKKIVRESDARRRESRAAVVAARRSIIADNGETDERKAKRVRISIVEDGEDAELQKTKAKEMDVDVGADEDQQTAEEKERERAAIKKRLEVSRARRRSSMGRVSVGAGKPPLIPNQPKKGIATRFGFLSSAKSLMKSVWNRGNTTTAAPQEAKPKPATHDMKPSAAAKAPTTNVLTKPNPAAQASVGSKIPSGKTAVAVPKADPNASLLRVPNTRLGLGRKSSIKVDGTVGTTKSSTSTASTNTSSRLSTASASSSARRAPIPSFSRLSGHISRTSSIAFSNGSTGTKFSMSSGSTGSSRLPAASSIGVKKLGKPSMASVRSSDLGGAMSASGSSMARKRTSTLLAPTASSLARMQSTVKPPSLPSTTVAAASCSDAMAVDPSPNPPIPQATHLNQIPTANFTFTSPRAKGSINTSTAVTPNRIFSNGTPLFTPTTTPARVPAAVAAATEDAPATTAAISGPKPRLLPSRRPRISRSRVIARVGAQRLASGGGSGIEVSSSSLSRTASGRRSLNTPKTRTSLGIRASGIGAKNGRRDSAAVMSARKRLRQSEVLRRRSKISVGQGDALPAANANRNQDGDIMNMTAEEAEEDDNHHDSNYESASAGMDVSMQD